MKSLISRVARWAAAFLGLITVSACYGVAYMEYNENLKVKVDGRVTDENDNPIEGIAVSEKHVGKTFTKADGSFSLSGGFCGEDSINIYFKDVDGEKNGGKFKDDDVEVNLTYVEGTDEFAADNVNIKLKLDDGRDGE